MVTEFEILDRVKPAPLGQAALDNFVLRERATADSAIVVNNPHISLYALDFESEQGVFVETPPEIDLCLEPFYYIAQYDHAQRLFTLPIAEMIALGSDLPLDEEKLIFIQSTGRAGSTLASQVFVQLDGVANISEPDTLVDLVAYRHHFPHSTGDLRAMTNAVVRYLCHVHAPGGHVVKGRSFVIELGDLFDDLFPRSKQIFLYRDAKSYMFSALRAFDDGVERSEAEMQGLLAGIRAWLTPLVPLIARTAPQQPLTGAHLVAYSWLSAMERHLVLHDAGVPLLAINYDSWLDDPRSTAAGMLEYSGMLPDDPTPVYAALERDSQAGTVLSRGAIKEHNELREHADPVLLAQILATRPVVNTASFVAPNTFSMTSVTPDP